MRDPRLLMFIRCLGRRESPVSFPGDVSSHQSFSNCTSDISYQSGASINTAQISNQYTEFSVRQELL